MKSILGNTRKADITFHQSGRICISSRVSRSLDLIPGDVIDIICDDREFYLVVKHRAPVVGRHEGMVFNSNKNGKHFIASSVKLCRFMLERCASIDRVRLSCGTPVELLNYGTVLPIIIKHILQ